VSTTRPTLSVDIDFTTDLSVGWSYTQRVLADGPAIYYQLRETSGTAATDASGNSVTGTYEGTFTLDQTSGKPVTGEAAARYVTLGSGGRVKFPKPESGVTQVALEAWVYRATLDGSTSTFYRIAEPEATGVDWMSFSVRGDGNLYMTSGYTDARTSTAPIAAATWYHVAVVMDVLDDTYTFFVNGVALTTTYVTAGITPRVGFQRTGGTNWFWGGYDGTRTAVSRIAEPAVYTSALTATQLLAHYNARAVAAFAGYTWTDVTADVLVDPGVSRDFGRESSNEEVVPMSLSYMLVNDDRKYEVGNTASAYFPNVGPGRPTRIMMTQDAVTYDWAFGFIEDWPQQWDDSGKFCRVQIVAHDSLERMNQQELGTRTFSEQKTGARIHSVANIAGIPTSTRVIDTGVDDVMAQTVEGGNTGDHARQVARTDRGLMFFDGRGYLIFQAGNYRTTNARSTASRGTLGPTGSVDIVTLGAPQFHSPSSLIRNEVTIRRPGGVDHTATDPASRARYGPRSHSDELLLKTEALAATRAADLLADYKDPQLRVRAIAFNPARSPGQWDHALGVQPSDRYTWRFEPDQGAAIVRDVFVEGVSDRWVGAEYRATWFLSLV
jgi:hypothetical protein